MADFPLFPVVVRWVHIFCACLLLGGPFFVRYVMMPAVAASLDEEARGRLGENVNRGWRMIVYLVITLFILSGLYTFVYVVMPVDLGRWRPAYHALFGIKMMLALGAFFLASAIPGRTAAFAPIRKNAGFYLTVLILMLLVILMLASGMRGIRERALAETVATTTATETQRH